MNSKTIENVLKYIVLTGLFAVLFIPLYVENNFFFPFITGKGFAFRIITEVIFASWILLFLRNKDFLPKWSGTQIALTIFVAIIFVADAMGLSFLRSFWSNFERMEGWIGLIHLWAYYIVLTTMMSSSTEKMRMWNRYLNTSIFASYIVSIYSFAQLFKLAAIHQGATRLDATLGNAIYLAAYMLFHTFISLYLASDLYEKGKKGLAWFYVASALIFSFITYETATRGAVLGMVIGIMFGLLILSAWGNTKRTRFASMGIILFIVLSGYIFWLNKDAKFIQNNEILKRFADISLEDTKTQARGFIWPMAVNGVFETKKTAIIGYGQENFNYLFNSHYNPLMWRHEQWFDRAHNSYLDWLVAGGVLGLFSYLAIFVFALVSLFKSNISINKKAVLVSVIIGYGIQGIFTFDNLTSYIFFLVIISFITTLDLGKYHSWIEKITLANGGNYRVFRDYLFSPIILIAFIIALYTLNVRPIQANTRLIKAMVSCSGGNNLPSVDAFKNALSLDQYVANQEIREQALSCGTNVVRSDLPQNLKESFALLVVSNIDRQINVTPNDARAFYLGGSFLNGVGNWSAANVLLERANQLSPNKQSIMFELATNYINSNRKDDAVALMKKAYESAPDNDLSRAGYISALIIAGKDKQAKEIFKNEPDAFYDDRLINVYMNLKMYDKAIELLTKLIEKNPTNEQYYLQRAGIYYTSGNKYRSIEELKAIGNKFPEIKKQTDAAIKEVQKELN